MLLIGAGAKQWPGAMWITCICLIVVYRIAQVLMGGNIDRFGAKLHSNLSKISPSIVSSSILIQVA